MNGDDFLTLLLSKADKSSSDTAYRALLLGELNLIVKDIQNRQDGFHWRFLEKTATAPMVATQFNYALPTDIDILKVVHVYGKTNDVTYKFIPYEKFKARVADETNATGEPYIFTIWAGELLLYPVPTGTTTMYIDYVQLITALTDAATSNEIPARYDKVVIDGVMIWVYEFDPELGDSLKQERKYEAGIQRMKTENHQMIAEVTQPVSHRARTMTRAFPLDDENY